MSAHPEDKPRAHLMSHRKTCKRFNNPGDAHALTFSCFHRQPFLTKDRTRRWFVDAIEQARQKHQFHLWAYVIMPEHAHLLVWPTRAQYDISAFLRSVKQSVVRKALPFIRREAPGFLPRMEDRQPNGETHYRFWQRGGGYDRNVFEPALVFQQINYIHNNPVRRALCERPEDWYWSGAAEYAGTGSGSLTVDRESLPELGRP